MQVEYLLIAVFVKAELAFDTQDALWYKCINISIQSVRRLLTFAAFWWLDPTLLIHWKYFGWCIFSCLLLTCSVNIWIRKLQWTVALFVRLHYICSYLFDSGKVMQGENHILYIHYKYIVGVVDWNVYIKDFFLNLTFLSFYLFLCFYMWLLL